MREVNFLSSILRCWIFCEFWQKKLLVPSQPIQSISNQVRSLEASIWIQVTSLGYPAKRRQIQTGGSLPASGFLWNLFSVNSQHLYLVFLLVTLLILPTNYFLQFKSSMEPLSLKRDQRRNLQGSEFLISFKCQITNVKFVIVCIHCTGCFSCKLTRPIRNDRQASLFLFFLSFTFA